MPTGNDRRMQESLGPGEARTAAATRCAIAIMAKAPRAGLSKTRLCPPLRPEEAAALSGAFLRDMGTLVLAAAASAPIDLFIAYAPADARDALCPYVPQAARMLAATGEAVREPGVDGFGRALLEAMRSLFALGYGAACVLNSDSPTLPAAYLARAARRLLVAPDSAVLGPSGDGGYYLLGLTRPATEPFRNVAWSTPGVAATTRARVAEAGLSLCELPAWDDVDDAAALLTLCRALGAGAVAPATRAWLDRAQLNHAALTARLAALAEER